MLGLIPHRAVLHSVELRSTDRDRLRLRQRLERALADVEWSPPGLPPHALLLVRKLAPQTGVGQRSFGRHVSLALEHCASRARRPWIHADAAQAEAVLFADEAELVACLVRDALRGAVADRWWWRSVLGSAGAEQWLRKHVLPRGDVLVPALSLLSARGEVVPYIARLQEPDVRVAGAAVARAFALPTSGASSCAADAAATADGDHGTAAAAVRTDVVSVRTHDAVARLMVTVPEMRSPGLGQEQRRLLAFVLVATRAPSWARTSQFEVAMVALDRIDSGADAVLSPSLRVGRSDAPARQTTSRVPIDTMATAPFGRSLPADGPPTQATGVITGEGTHSPRLEVAKRPPDQTRSDEMRLPPAREREHESEMRQVAIDPIPSQEARAVTPAKAPADQGSHGDTEWAPPLAQPEPGAAPAAAAQRVETEYGGIFYLLNAWIAMELYGDFTAPRARNLALSPWDLLALVGRAWFGAPFVSDPVWKLLADLAVRDPEDEPGCDVDLPDTWLDQHLEILNARLQLALRCKEPTALPDIVCRHHALIEMTTSTLRLHLALRDLPLDVRIAGLDRDPGWIPAAGRAVYFHFA